MVGPSLNSHHFTPKSSTTTSIKFLCSYGGKILPRYPDAKLRYHGGETRVLAVDRSVSFSQLLVKLGELCGTASFSLRCQLPTEDLDALVSITSDEDLANLIEEYERAASQPLPLKIRAFLSLPKKFCTAPSSASSSSSSSTATTLDAASPRSPSTASYSAGAASYTSRFPIGVPNRCFRQIPKPVVYLVCYNKSAGKLPCYAYYAAAHGNASQIYLIHNGNHWQ